MEKVLKYNKTTIDDIIKIGNSCGIIACYFIAKIFNIDFNLASFSTRATTGNGMTLLEFIEWVTRNKLNWTTVEQTYLARHGDLDLIRQNDCVVFIAGEYPNNEGQHGTLLYEKKVEVVDGKNKFYFKSLYCLDSNVWLELKDIKNSTIFIVANNINNLNKIATRLRPFNTVVFFDKKTKIDVFTTKCEYGELSVYTMVNAIADYYSIAFNSIMVIYKGDVPDYFYFKDKSGKFISLDYKPVNLQLI